MIGLINLLRMEGEYVNVMNMNKERENSYLYVCKRKREKNKEVHEK